MVAISAFGGLSVHIMTSSRMLFVGARNGHFPEALAHINIKKFTPIPSLFFLVSLSFFYCSVKYDLEVTAFYWLNVHLTYNVKCIFLCPLTLMLLKF